MMLEVVIWVVDMEVDKMGYEVIDMMADMEVDKVIDMVVKVSNEELYWRDSGDVWYLMETILEAVIEVVDMEVDKVANLVDENGWKFMNINENVAKEEVVNTVPDCNVIEEEASFEARAQDACTQTPQRRRGGGW